MRFFLIPLITGFLMSSVSMADDTISPETLALLRAKRDIARTWAPTCADGTQSHGICPFADMTIFSGMSCLAGETARCEDVRKAQGPDGRWWRSPSVVGDSTQTNSFSRDQSRGVLAYLVATKDVKAAIMWETYLNSHDREMCPDATDNRCHITAGSGRLFGAVWTYLGLKTSKWMKRGLWISDAQDQLLALLKPDGFPLHLDASNVWIRREIERRNGPAAEDHDQKVMKILVKREPENPFYQLLRNGPTQKVADLILRKCPDIKPEFERLDWAWQRSQDTSPWLHSSGHDCIFIVDVFERELALLNPLPATPEVPLTAPLTDSE